MSRAKQTKNNNFYLAIAVLLVALVIFAVVKKQQTPYEIQPVQVQDSYLITKSVNNYYFKFLKISLDIPSNYKVEDNQSNTIILRRNDINAEIQVNKIATNYDSIDGYLGNLTEKNNLSILEKEVIKINEKDFVLVTFNNKDKYYFYYPTAWRIYSISTKNSDLYSDLDQIARSFKYQP